MYLMSPRNKEKSKDIRDQRQQELRRSAIQMFSQKGYAAAKISDITSNAHLSHGLFYHYFKSKEELYREVIRDILYDFIELVEEANRLELSALDKMEWLTEVTHSSSIREGVYRHILILQALYSDHLNDSAVKEIVALYKEAADGIVNIIQTGQEEGDFIEGDPHELAMYHLSLSHGLLLSNARMEHQVKLSTDKVLRQLIKGGTNT